MFRGLRLFFVRTFGWEVAFAPADPPLVTDRPVARPVCRVRRVGLRHADMARQHRRGRLRAVVLGRGVDHPPRPVRRRANPGAAAGPQPRPCSAEPAGKADRRSGPDRAGDAAGAQPRQPLQRRRRQHAEPGRGGGVVARLCAEFAVERRLCDRPCDPASRRSVSRRVSAAACRAGVGPANPLGRQ